MSKKNKSGNNKPKQKTVPPAPAVETQKPRADEKKEEKVEVAAEVENPSEVQLDNIGKALEERGLDPNHRVDLMTLAYQYYHKDDGAAAKKAGLSQALIDNVDHITMISIAAEYASEMTYAKTPFAISLRKTVLPEMQSALKELGITMSDKVLALPASTEGTVEVTPTDIKIPAAVKKEVRETVESRNATVEMDPTKITSEKDLSNTLKHLVVNPSVFKGLNDAINFYRSYLKTKAKDDKKELERINAMSTREIIGGIAKVTNICPFVTKGFGSYLLRLATEAKSIVPAYAALYLAVKNKRTGNPEMSDKEVAEIAAALIDWTANVRIAAKEKNLEVLNKDTKKNKSAIDQVNKDISTLKEAMNLSIDPSSDFADNLLENLKAKDKQVAQTARNAYMSIQKAYYPEAGRGKAYENLASNIQQHAGIIINLFRNPLAQITEYSESNLTELVEAKQQPKEEKPAESVKPEAEEKPAEKTETKEDSSKKEPKKAVDLGSKKK